MHNWLNVCCRHDKKGMNTWVIIIIIHWDSISGPDQLAINWCQVKKVFEQFCHIYFVQSGNINSAHLQTELYMCWYFPKHHASRPQVCHWLSLSSIFCLLWERPLFICTGIRPKSTSDDQRTVKDNMFTYSLLTWKKTAMLFMDLFSLFIHTLWNTGFLKRGLQDRHL